MLAPIPAVANQFAGRRLTQPLGCCLLPPCRLAAHVPILLVCRSCEYTADLETPAACTPDTAAALQVGAARALIGSIMIAQATHGSATGHGCHVLDVERPSAAHAPLRNCVRVSTAPVCLLCRRSCASGSSCWAAVLKLMQRQMHRRRQQRQRRRRLRRQRRLRQAPRAALERSCEATKPTKRRLCESVVCTRARLECSLPGGLRCLPSGPVSVQPDGLCVVILLWPCMLVLPQRNLLACLLSERNEILKLFCSAAYV